MLNILSARARAALLHACLKLLQKIVLYNAYINDTTELTTIATTTTIKNNKQ